MMICILIESVLIFLHLLIFFISIYRSPLVYRRDRESLPIEGAGGSKGKKVGYTDLA